MNDKKDCCPTLSGKLSGYKSQIFLNNKWSDIPKRKAKIGVPAPLHQGGILSEVGLSGYNQAMAIAYWCAAEYEAHGHNVEVRVVPYQVTFSIKSKEIK